jgi:hypothetical protein
MTEADSKPRIVNIFITAAEAWDWIKEQSRSTNLLRTRQRAEGQTLPIT